MSRKLYDFKCSQEHITESFVADETTTILCECGLEANRIISPIRISLDGTDHAETDYPYVGHLNSLDSPTFDFNFGVPDYVFWSMACTGPSSTAHCRGLTRSVATTWVRTPSRPRHRSASSA